MNLEELAEKTKYMEDLSLPRKSELLEDILKRSPVEEFEKIIDGFAVDEKQKTALSLAHALRVSRDKENALLAHDDTMLCNELDRYQRILSDLDFEKTLEVPFQNRETFFVYFRKKGAILLAFDTYGSRHVNSGNFYYNWKPNAYPDFPRNVLSTGGFQIADEVKSHPEMTRDWEEKWARECVWVGSHDCREALRLKVRKLEEHGTLLDKWQFPQSLFLVNHAEKDRSQFNEIIESRVALLPDFVKEAINER